MDVYERCERKLDAAVARCDALTEKMRELRTFSYRTFLFLIFAIATETFTLSVVVYFALLHAARVPQ